MEEVELSFVIFHSQEIRHELWTSEGLINYDGLIPVCWRCDVLPCCCLWIVSSIGVKIQMSWLYELVHKIHGLWLLSDERASSCKHVVSFLSTILFVIVVVNVPDDTSSFLLNENV